MKNHKFFPFLILTLLILILTACSKDKLTDIPPCIETRIEDAKDFACPNSSIAEYRFQHRSVFVFGTDGCSPDAGVYVLDINCNEAGYLFGLHGTSKIDGVEFFDNAKLIRILWEN